jgi:TPR repeat protein
LQRARELLRAGIAPEQAVELAKNMQTSEGADGAFLLLEDAAQKGNPEAMLGLARFYDPADDAPRGSILPDPAQARDWYNKARDRGQAGAEDKLKALRAWAEGAKDTHPQAKSLLDGWK